MGHKSHDDLQAWRADSYLAGGNSAYLDELYEDYLQDPSSVSPEWQQYFSGLGAGREVSHAQVRAQFKQASGSRPSAAAPQAGAIPAASMLQTKVDALINAYRQHGHRAAQLDPLGAPVAGHSALQLSFHALNESDLAAQVLTRGVLATQQASLKELYAALQKIYCGFASAEFSYVSDVAEQEWLQKNIEGVLGDPVLSAERQQWLMQQLVAAEGLENYLGIKYVGQKRFSIEGLETLIPQLNTMIEVAAGCGVQQVVMGMAHRGRLNVMLNVAGMSARELFAEFEGKEDYGQTSGDVRYHLGSSVDVKTAQGNVHVSLAFNPSHLEFINPVLVGGVRARQQVEAAGEHDFALGILMHGDSAFAGEGVVYESLNMAQLRGYTVGGTLHIITNNQIGFTTSDTRDTRSSCHASDIAKLIEAPVLHVNADHPELAILVAELAVRYRMQFHKDIVINLVGYRRHGHQEVDEPTSSAPQAYQHIAQHATVQQLYAEQLAAQHVIGASVVEEYIKDYQARLDQGAYVVNVIEESYSEADFHQRWLPYLEGTWDTPADTTISAQDTARLAQVISSIPADMQLVKPVAQIVASRAAMAAGQRAMDWGFAENMAYASLLAAGVPLRMSGQDVRRGTFYHRHAFWFDANSGASYSPLMHLGPQQGKLQMYDSILNETAVMGFEYGYSCTDPSSLVIWEAQFGDFANTAQVIIDQFISSAWQKWQRLSGLVLLLPHGYDGAGPEHSSARLERYLQLAAQKNIQVAMPTTPAQIFHLLRRQSLRPFRHPLVVMTPKSLLRHKMATSTLDDLQQGCFQLLIPEVDALVKKQVRRVVLCAGKIYYELLQLRRDKKIKNIALIRIEQLYPFPYEQLKTVLAAYSQAVEVVWCQEEPKNQGAWYVTRDRIQACLQADQALSLVSRPASAAPSVGYHALHVQQQQQVLSQALSIEKNEN